MSSVGTNGLEAECDRLAAENIVNISILIQCQLFYMF